ncbi:MAG: hypothetical protein HMLKMBBP_03950 [Planctomycetes bacterium]|nr:hypothetical protein [Planctomycetota bacterium]
MRKPLAALGLAFALLASSVPPAAAAPFTDVLDPLVVTLGLRRATLTEMGDPASLAQAKVLGAALGKAKKTKSKSLLGDIGILKSMASTMEKKLGPNDPDLVAALDAVIARVQTVVNDVRAAADAAFDPEAAGLIAAIATEADAILESVRNPSPEENTVTARAGRLKSALKKLLSALGIASDDSKCSGRGELTTTFSGGGFNPPFIAATAYLSGGTPTRISITSYTYDRKNPEDPYHGGQVDVDLFGASAAVGSFDVAGGQDSPSVSFRREGVGPDDDVGGFAESGTVTVTRLDPEDEQVEGRFSVVIRFLDDSTLQVSGRFRACSWQRVEL